MSAFHQGKLGTMKAHYTIDAGDLRVIRPLVYVRETQTAAFAAAATLPVVPDSCPACFTRTDPARPYQDPAGARGKGPSQPVCQSAQRDAPADG